MKIYKNISNLVTLRSAFRKDGRFLAPEDMDIIENGAVVFDNDTILYVGHSLDIPTRFSHAQSYDLSGYTLTPELVDSHTHLVFAGDRAKEYSQRLNGEDYQQIAEKGGGIQYTSLKTLEASPQELFESACQRVELIHSYGVGTIEIKSGYCLNCEGEKKLTLVIDELKKKYSDKIQIFNTFMAAHAIPKNFNTAKQYLDEIVIPLMHEMQTSIDAVDIFHEQGYFDTSDVELLFEEAKKLNISRKIHADEFNDNNGAALAAKWDCLSADHLLATSAKGASILGESKTVATFLPGTALFLGKPLVNAKKFLSAGAKVAIASDYNPGSCNFDNVLAIASMTAKNLEMNMAQMWSALTMNSAHSLGLNKQGAIIEGLKPRFSLFSTDSVEKITYHWGKNFSTSLI